MKINKFKTAEDVAKAIHEHLKKRAKGKLRVFLPAGKTPLPLYALVRQSKEFWGPRLEGIQIDEFVNPSRVFWNLLQNELGYFNIIGWDPQWADDEIEKHVKKTLNQKIDVALLGLGPNGHVGFHEPGQPASFLGGRVTISEQTFRRIPDAKTREALTFGVGAFLETSEILLMVTGEEKRSIWEKLMASTPNVNLPASLLKNHPNFSVFTDL